MFTPLLLALAACAPDAAPPAARAVPAGPEPAWPTVIAEDAAPEGYSWQTLRHAQLHARLLVPDGAYVTKHDGDPPTIRIENAGIVATLSYTPRAAWYVPGPLATPARFGDSLRETPNNVAWQVEIPDGGARVVAYARGAACEVTVGPFDRKDLAAAFTLCASLRPPPPGPWGPPGPRPASTAIPTGAWVEPSRAEMVGDSLLGPYAPRIYTGWYGLAHTNCPKDYAVLATVEEGESDVAVTRADSPAGPAHVRLARATRDGVTFTSGARVVAPRGDGCCSAELFPFRGPPSIDEIAYIVSLCDTTGGTSK